MAKVVARISAVVMRLRSYAAVLVLLGSAVVVPFAAAGPASAATGSSDLCTGFSGCASAGYPNFGYSSVYTHSYWGQDAGHNCTNYVAYRFTAAGVGKPSWLGTGNAVDWGLWAPAGIVNSTPSVGAIAWWGPSSAYAQFGGHVSIVQQVNADGSFIESDDNFGGDFHWRKYTPGGSAWPTAFIHYNDAALGGGTGPVSILAGNNNGQMTIQLVNFPLGLSYYFCHAGDPSGYPTGGAVTSHGSFTVSSPSQYWSSGLCAGSGNSWVGIQATDGNSYYSNQVTLGSAPPGIIVSNNSGQMTIQLVNFPLGLSYYFCHAGDPSGYPTGGGITSHGSFTVSSPSQYWSSGLCAGSGNSWVGIQATDGNSYYSNQVTLSAVPPSISIGNNDGQMTVQLANFPLGTSYFFCHNGAASGYPTGGAIANHGSFTVSSPSQSWSSGLCSGKGNFWVGIQATDGNSYYSNQTVLGPPPVIETSGLPGGVLAKPYSATVRAGAGTGSYAWSIIGRALPKGLSLSAATGAIKGTPKASGTYTVVIKVTDADGYAASTKLTLKIAALGVKTTALPVGTVHKAYKATLAAYGGMAPLTWWISGGHLPPGLRLSKSGVISGTPTKAGTFTLIVKVTDAATTKHSAARALTLTIKE